MHWNNSSNIPYYENIPVEELRNFAIKGGFENGCDIEQLEEYILGSNSILDLGAGYGRVLNKILKMGFSGDLSAVERSGNLCKYLKENFNNDIEFIQADLLNLNFGKTFDLVLWMWSGISEYQPSEYSGVILQLLELVNPNGHLVLETLDSSNIPINSNGLENRHYTIKYKDDLAHGYLPSIQELSNSVSELGITNIKHINYKTTTGRKRILHILKKDFF